MPAYVIADVEVTDTGQHKQCMAPSPGVAECLNMVAVEGV